MKYNESLAKLIIEQLEAGNPVVLISIVSLQGSSPRHFGTKMLVTADGKSYGTIGGSLMEATAIAESKSVIRQKHSRLMNFDLDGANAYAANMICGGKTVLLLDYLAPDTANREFCRQWYDALVSGGNFYFLTHIKEGEIDIDVLGHSLVLTDDSITGNCPMTEADAVNLKANLKNMSATTVFTAGNGSIIVDPMRKLKTVYCFGGGHVAMPTVRITAMAGFRVVVLDDRDEFANAERFPDADEIRIIKDYNRALEGMEIDEDSYIVILTRGHQYDREVLEQSLRTDAGYIGMISSRRKRDTIYKALMAEGVSRERLEYVHSPIGLDIGAETPEEIAISIVSELISVRQKQQG